MQHALAKRQKAQPTMSEPDARLALANDCAVNSLDLLAAVYKLAIKDAGLGDADAIEFLNVTTPDWRELSAQHQTERTGRARLNATQK